MVRNVRLMRLPAAPARRGTLCIQPCCTPAPITSSAPSPRRKRYLTLWSALQRSRKSRGAPSDTEAAAGRGTRAAGAWACWESSRSPRRHQGHMNLVTCAAAQNIRGCSELDCDLDCDILRAPRWPGWRLSEWPLPCARPRGSPMTGRSPNSRSLSLCHAIESLPLLRSGPATASGAPARLEPRARRHARSAASRQGLAAGTRSRKPAAPKPMAPQATAAPPVQVQQAGVEAHARGCLCQRLEPAHRRVPGRGRQRGTRVGVAQLRPVRLVGHQARLRQAAPHDAHAALLPRQLAVQRGKQRRSLGGGHPVGAVCELRAVGQHDAPWPGLQVSDRPSALGLGLVVRLVRRERSQQALPLAASPAAARRPPASCRWRSLGIACGPDAAH